MSLRSRGAASSERYGALADDLARARAIDDVRGTSVHYLYTAMLGLLLCPARGENAPRHALADERSDVALLRLGAVGDGVPAPSRKSLRASPLAHTGAAPHHLERDILGRVRRDHS